MAPRITFLVINLLYILVCLPSTQSQLTSLGTKRFPPTDNNLFTMPPSLKSLASHANIGSKGAFRLKSGQFHATASGGKRVRLVQTYANYDVFGSSVVAEADSDGIFNGELSGEIAKSLKWQIFNPGLCKRNVTTLQNIAIRREGLKTSDPNIIKRDGRRIIFASPHKRAKLAYRVEFFYSDGDVRKWPVYFMDACTSFVLLSYDNIHNGSLPEKRTLPNDTMMSQSQSGSSVQTLFGSQKVAGICSPYINGKGGNDKTGKRTYNLEPLCLKMQKSGATCRMQGTYVKVMDNKGSTTYNNDNVISFGCIIGYQDGVNGAHGVANDAFFYGEESGRLFQEKYDMRALPYVPRMVTHYGNGVDNAFWDGTDMYFGDGQSLFYPLVALDVIAHELAHGITTRNSDLVYRGQSGGINEAFSDITGEVTKHFVLGSNDWEVGSSIFKGNGALRYFYDPPKDGRSIKNAWTYRVGMDVHFSSGVFNLAFYNMVKKERMDIYEAYKCFLDANLNLWGQFSNYFTAACNVMQAAYDNGFNHRKVRRSFFRVGIPLIFCNYWRFRATLRTGEKRQNVLVKNSRAPMFHIDMTTSSIAKPSRVRATTKDDSPVTVVVATDKDGENVIASGENEVSIDLGKDEVFIKLLSNQTADVKATLEIF